MHDPISQRASFVVIGGGIIGSACAYFLAKRGLGGRRW